MVGTPIILITKGGGGVGDWSGKMLISVTFNKSNK